MTARPTVLIVDDEAPMREIVALALEPAGYAPILAASGAEAIRVLSTADVDVLLTDVMMPEINGVELARHARARCPDIGLVFMSGCAGPDVADEFDGAAFIAKPFTADEIAAAVAEGLEAVARTA